MVEEHYVFDDPNDPDVKIWRYMDFTKFVWLLQFRRLFFSRSDQLGDPFEGSLTRLNEMLRSISAKNLNPESPETYLKIFDDLSSFRQYIRQWTYVSCWHMNEYESAAMWKTYTKTNESIAIQSIYSTLKELLPENIYMGVVKYIDYDTEIIPEFNTFYPFIHKQKSFEHEKEVRAIIQDIPKTPKGGLDRFQTNLKNGVSIKIEPADYITSIYIAPTSPIWFKELVGEIITVYKINCDVIQSSMDKDPVF